MSTLKPEDFDTLAEHPAFAALLARVAEMIEHHRGDLERDIPQECTWKVRGACAVLRRVLELPQIMREEAEAATASAKRPR